MQIVYLAPTKDVSQITDMGVNADEYYGSEK